MGILIFLSTIQKFIPLIILINIYFNLLINLLFSILIIPSVVRLNKILAVSSVNNFIYIIRWYTSFIRFFKKIFNFKNFSIRRKNFFYFNNYFFFFSDIILLFISSLFFFN